MAPLGRSGRVRPTASIISDNCTPPARAPAMPHPAGPRPSNVRRETKPPRRRCPNPIAGNAGDGHPWGRRRRDGSRPAAGRRVDRPAVESPTVYSPTEQTPLPPPPALAPRLPLRYWLPFPAPFSGSLFRLPLLPLPPASAPCLCPLPLPPASAPCLCPLPLPPASAPCLCPLPLPPASAPCLCPLPLPPASAPCLCPLPLPPASPSSRLSLPPPLPRRQSRLPREAREARGAAEAAPRGRYRTPQPRVLFLCLLCSNPVQQILPFFVGAPGGLGAVAALSLAAEGRQWRHL